MGIKLPAIRSVRGKYFAGVLTIVLTAVLYVVPNRLYGSSGTLLPMTLLDIAIPFWPASGVIYATTFAFLLGTFISIRDLSDASRFLYACLFAQVLAAACFALWPTTYPRELYPISTQLSPFGAALVRFFRDLDSPANCLPSLHVSATALCVAVLNTRRHSIAAVVAGLLFTLSTLTFKQHYVVDVLAGLALGLLAYFLFFRWRGLTVVKPGLF